MFLQMGVDGVMQRMSETIGMKPIAFDENLLGLEVLLSELLGHSRK